MQEIILLRGQNLSYAKESNHLRKRILSKDESLVIKDVSFTLYRGEVLGVLGEYETLYYLKDMITETVNPKSGKVKTDAVIASLDVMDHVQNRHQTKVFLSQLFDEYMKPQKVTEVLAELNKKQFIKRIWTREVNTLTRADLASLLVEAANFIEADIFIFCNMSSHLTDSGKMRFRETVSAFEKEDRGIMLLETDIRMIKDSSNYFLWLSYGQVRYDGSVQKGIDRYNRYLRDRSQIKNVDEEAMFDLKWKRNISEYAHYMHNMQRLSKKQTSLIDQLSLRRLIISFVLLFIVVVSAAVIFMDINFTGAEETVERQTMTMGEDEFTESFAYGFVMTDGLEIGGTVPYFTLVDITSVQDESYTVVLDGEEYAVAQEDILYFNPASLYTETSFEELLPYTGESFAGSYQFYTRLLGRDAEAVTEELNLEADEYRGIVPGQPISYHFRNDRALAIQFPAEDINSLLSEYDLTEERQIFRVQDGYMVLDGINENWLYISR